MNKQSAKSADIANETRFSLAEAGYAPLTMFQSLAEHNVKLAMHLNQGWAKFVERRLERDQKFLGDISECRDWPAICNLQNSWASQALADYLEESRWLTELVREHISEIGARAAGARPSKMQ
jgi:Phasin protein